MCLAFIAGFDTAKVYMLEQMMNRWHSMISQVRIQTGSSMIWLDESLRALSSCASRYYRQMHIWTIMIHRCLPARTDSKRQLLVKLAICQDDMCLLAVSIPCGPLVVNLSLSVQICVGSLR